MDKIIRDYQKTDFDGVISLLKKNTPEYFDVREEIDFREYLDSKLEQYFVVEADSEIIGCGGINHFPQDKSARISWDMVDPKCQGHGVGKALVEYRINQIKTAGNINTVVVRTSQLVYPFYERCGFELKKIENDFWAEGYDLYLMEMYLPNNE